jgi:hypothetical protein
MTNKMYKLIMDSSTHGQAGMLMFIELIIIPDIHNKVLFTSLQQLETA